MRALFTVAATSLVVAGQAASAQVVPLAFEILPETVSAQATQCGVSEDLQKSALRAAMRYNRVGERAPDPTSQAPFIYTNVNTLKFGDVCVSSVLVEIEQYARGPNGFGEAVRDNVFCRKASMLSGPNGLHANQVSDEIKSLFDHCLSEMQDRLLK